MLGEILYAVLWCVFFVVVVIGFFLKRYTKRRLEEIDGFQGIVQKKDCPQKAIAVEIKVMQEKER